MHRILMIIMSGQLLLAGWNCSRQLQSSKTPLPVIDTLFINHYKTSCIGETQQLCYLVRTNPDDDWEYFYDEIDGLDYQWGNTYTLAISTKRNPRPVPGASGITFHQEKVIEQQPVSRDSLFDMVLHRNVLSRQSAVSKWAVLGGPAINFANEGLEKRFHRRVEQDSTFRVAYKYQEDGSGLLLVRLY